MRNGVLKIGPIFASWQEWAKTARHDEDGWQAGFPEWRALVDLAGALMMQQEIDNEDFQILEACWLISEEGEELADFAKANFEQSWPILIRLISSKYAQVRWQIYDVLGEGGEVGERWVRLGLDDEDAYCRRRAILSLARLRPSDAKIMASRFLNDPDPYIRQAAAELAKSGTDEGAGGGKR